MAETMPSLQEIADMPYSKALEACRKWIHPQWGQDVPEDGLKRRYVAKVTYTVRDTVEYTVWAFTEEEAHDAALDEFYRDKDVPSDAEYDGADLTEVQDG